MALDTEGICTLLQVFDMPRSVAFYRDIFGFEVVMSSQPGDDFDWGLLRRGSAELMLNTQYERHRRPPAPDPSRFARHADTSLFFHCHDLDAAFAQLRDRGLDVKPPVSRSYGMKQLAFTDPDGYGICLQCPAPS